MIMHEVEHTAETFHQDSGCRIASRLDQPRQEFAGRVELKIGQDFIHKTTTLEWINAKPPR